jgi:transketolase N-terminal domain/subunit
MNVINADIRSIIIKIISKSSAAHAGTCLSEVEILNSVYKSVNKKKLLNQIIL